MNKTTAAKDVRAGMRANSGRTCRCMLVLLCAVLYPATGRAEPAPEESKPKESTPQIWINPGIYSYHFDTSKDLRNNNIGFGVEAVLVPDHVLMAGTFINSNDAHTRFAGYEWRPLHWNYSGVDISAGIVVGAFDGYPNYRNGAWFAAPLPMLSIEGKRFGANLALIPTVANRFDGALAIQVKLRVW